MQAAELQGRFAVLDCYRATLVSLHHIPKGVEELFGGFYSVVATECILCLNFSVRVLWEDFLSVWFIFLKAAFERPVLMA
ncbi:hypothetical protein Nepgr_015879 [Nepenthes gracilis]|uniref:Uncharacterized protein n=1 Tax=Nepenthes gracilis TaxID=150966 RepID=A0AAD3XR41_NEPGR|nr:hypothetical protein Nepgr_015879 [Nepenthes gracilis]